jgi:hypothetical protein
MLSLSVLSCREVDGDGDSDGGGDIEGMGDIDVEAAQFTVAADPPPP